MAAEKARTDLTEVGRKLGRNPYMGRPRLREGERQFSVPRWSKVFVYRVQGNQVVIERLRDTRMQTTDES